MNRINPKLFDRAKKYFPSDRHELRVAAGNFHYIKREYEDWKSELDLLHNFTTPEMELYYLAISTAMHHFETSFEFSQALEYLLDHRRANIVPAICIILRQSLESALTASWICAEPDIKNIAQRGFQVTIRDLNNQYNFAKELRAYDSADHNLTHINMEQIEMRKLELLIIGNQLGYRGRQVKEIYKPLITKLFKNSEFAGKKRNLNWAYTLLSSIGHGTWIGFYPADKELTAMVKMRDQSLRETLNKLRTRTAPIARDRLSS